VKRALVPDVARLREEHARLIEILGRLELVVAQPAPPPTTELFTLRLELTSALVGHLKTEDWMVYPKLIASRDKQVAATARAMAAEIGGLAADFAAFSEAWGATEIARDWPGYRRAATFMIGALAKRIARENRELYPLIEAAVARAA
jgi:iron-sulfur cluster repair protein YtfE (RIC family)